MIAGAGARPVEQPVGAFVGGEPVDVQQGLPLGLWRAIGLKCCPAPDATWIGGVLPEIVETPAVAGDVGDVVRAIVDGREHVPVGGKLRAAEFFQRALILRRDEIERADAFDILQPKIRVVVGDGQRRAVVDRRHGQGSAHPGRHMCDLTHERVSNSILVIGRPD